MKTTRKQPRKKPTKLVRQERKVIITGKQTVVKKNLKQILKNIVKRK